MSEHRKVIIPSNSAEETESLGERIGAQLRGGEVIDLISDLGGGKTTFVRGLAHGIASRDHVSSPTFTVSKLYEGGKLRIHHFDFYRLNEAGIVANELAELLEDPQNVVVVEWSASVERVLPQERIGIKIERVASGEDDRQIHLDVPPQFAYIFDTIDKQ